MVALGALAFIIALAITEPLGPGLDPDSMSYLHAASSLVQHGALRDIERDWTSPDSTKPLTHWPPGYPAAIAATMAVGMTAVQGARLVQAIAAFGWAALLAWLVGVEVGVGAAAVVGIAALSTPAVVALHENVLSEPFFLFTLLATLAAMVRRPDRPLWAGLAAAAASMVRYVGISLVAAAMVWPLLRRGRELRDRRQALRALREAALTALPTIALQGVWLVRSLASEGADRIREVGLYGSLGDALEEGVWTLVDWLAPRVSDRWQWLAAAAMALAIIGVAVTAWRKARHTSERARGSSLAAASLTIVACYAGLLMASRALADPRLPFDDRLLAPAILLLEVAVAVAAAAWWRAADRAGRLAAAVVGLAWWAGSLTVSRESVQYGLATGNDFADVCWRGAPVIAWVRDRASDRPLFTNAAEPLYFHAGRDARDLPSVALSDTLKAFADTVAKRHGVLVIFSDLCGGAEDAKTVLAGLEIAPITALRGDTVWEVRGARPPAPPPGAR